MLVLGLDKQGSSVISNIEDLKMSVVGPIWQVALLCQYEILVEFDAIPGEMM